MRHYAILLAIFSTGVLAEKNHCTAQEQMIFSCKIEKSSKVVSLCASKQLTKNHGFLVYRFGPIGKVELEYPPSQTNSVQQFRHAHYFRPQVDRTEVSFTNGKTRYTVFDYYDEQESPKNSLGVRVANIKSKKNVINLLCSNEGESKLQKLEEVVPCDSENALASCD